MSFLFIILGVKITLTLLLPDMTKGKFDKNSKFHFVKFFKTNNTT